MIKYCAYCVEKLVSECVKYIMHYLGGRTVMLIVDFHYLPRDGRPDSQLQACYYVESIFWGAK